MLFRKDLKEMLSGLRNGDHLERAERLMKTALAMLKVKWRSSLKTALLAEFLQYISSIAQRVSISCKVLFGCARINFFQKTGS
jgi:hypothetical protein